MLNIKVLGSGCPNCKKVEAITRQAIDRMGVQAQIVKVTDFNKFIDYNILSTPALVINEKVVCAGRIPTEAEVTAWLASVV